MDRYVLVADDEGDLVRQVERELAVLTAPLVAVSDGRAAAEVLERRGPPAILVTDLNLPGRDGFDLLRVLRALDRGAEVPAIVASRFPSLVDEARRLVGALGPLFVFDKPLPFGVILLGAREAFPATATAPHHVVPRLSSADAEARRLSRITELGLDDTREAPDPDLQAFVARVAREFDVPIALASLVLRDRQWFKAYTGLQGRLLADRGTERAWAFCDHVVQGGAPFVVPDARTHPVFANNPLVVSGEITGYAGAPLRTASGDVLGTLCIIDTEPLTIDPDGVQRLITAARAIAGEIEVRALRQRQPAANFDPSLVELTLPYFTAMFDVLETGIVLMRADRRAFFANRAMAELFGVTARALLGRTRSDLVALLANAFSDPADVQRLQIANDGPWVLREEFELRGPPERVIRWTSRPVALPDGIGQLIAVTDVTSDVQFARAQERLARHDPLTGALNRRGAEEALNREVARFERFGGRLSIVLIDVDGFKHVNDTLGHAAGDAVLQRVVDLVRAQARAIDAVARWGGDELLLVLPDAELEGARSFAERARTAVADARLSTGPGKVTLSIGVVEARAEEPVSSIIARADACLYDAKRQGRNRVIG